MASPCMYVRKGHPLSELSLLAGSGASELHNRCGIRSFEKVIKALVCFL